MQFESSLLQTSESRPHDVTFSKMSTTKNVLPPFLRLPIELHLSIIDQLNTGNGPLACICLRLTNRYFYSAIPAADYTTLERIELSSPVRQKGLLACKYCLRLRPMSAFAISMIWRDVFGTKHRQRFCADCGFSRTSTDQEDQCTPGTEVMMGGMNGPRWLWCTVWDKVRKNDTLESGTVCWYCLLTSASNPKGTSAWTAWEAHLRVSWRKVNRKEIKESKILCMVIYWSSKREGSDHSSRHTCQRVSALAHLARLG